jgi:hypothetical protein
MHSDLFAFGRRAARQTDSNSLLRLYDEAKTIYEGSGSAQERIRAEKALQIVAQELRKRNVSF